MVVVLMVLELYASSWFFFSCLFGFCLFVFAFYGLSVCFCFLSLKRERGLESATLAGNCISHLKRTLELGLQTLDSVRVGRCVGEV